MAFGKLLGFLIAFGLGAALVPGCSKQGEGERCDKDAARNEDCDSGLVCIPKNQLADESTDRCCPPDGSAISDSRCSRSGAPPSGGGGAPGEGGAPASEGGAPASEGGAPATNETSGAGGA